MRGIDDARAAELVGQAASGDSIAWDALVEAYGRLVWAIARGELRSAGDAADVSQTTWLRLYEHIDRLDDPCRVGAWLATTARREARRVAARGRRILPMDDTSMLRPWWGEDADVDEALLANERIDGLYEAIAHTLQVPIGSIGPTRARCLRKLRSHLAPLEDSC
jgi:DNA-directed RNA polymerase specialized sigma24 family protein